MRRPTKCRCDPSRNGDLVFVGPGEGPKHKEAVSQARQSWLQLRRPDTVIRCPHDMANMQFVMRSDLCRESPRFQQFLENNPSTQEIILKAPVSTQHLHKLADFLFTGDYAVVQTDVLTYKADMSHHKTKCKMCNNHYRLLSLHLGMFMTGRALDMELLQLLAMHKFAEAAEGASGAVLKFIVEDIYSMEPPKDEYGNWFGLAGFDDFRPSMIIPAVVNYIRRNQPSFDWLRAFVFGGSAYMVTTAQKVGHAPEDEFRELREWCPEFNEDLAMGLQMAAMGQYGPNV